MSGRVETYFELDDPSTDCEGVLLRRFGTGSFLVKVGERKIVRRRVDVTPLDDAARELLAEVPA